MYLIDPSLRFEAEERRLGDFTSAPDCTESNKLASRALEGWSWAPGTAYEIVGLRTKSALTPVLGNVLSGTREFSSYYLR